MMVWDEMTSMRKSYRLALLQLYYIILNPTKKNDNEM